MFREIRDAIRRRFAPRRERWVMPTALFATLAAILVALTAVVPLRTGILRESFVRAYAAELLASVAPDAYVVFADDDSAAADIEFRVVQELQRKGVRPDVHIYRHTDPALAFSLPEGDDASFDHALVSSVAGLLANPNGLTVYVSYPTDQMPFGQRTVANGYLYAVVRPDEDVSSAVPSGVRMEFPETGEADLRAFISMAAYRYAAYLQETEGKEAALPFLLRAIEDDPKEGSAAYQAYVARRQLLIDHGEKR
jgi:hypothetical protein